MTNLQDKIAALKAGDYDVVLEDANRLERNAISKASDSIEDGHNKLWKAAILNAAKVIVLEEQVRVLRESLVTARKHLMEPEFGTSYSAMCGGAVGTMDAALAATDMGE